MGQTEKDRKNEKENLTRRKQLAKKVEKHIFGNPLSWLFCIFFLSIGYDRTWYKILGGGGGSHHK